jgi:hypothetical protein
VIHNITKRNIVKCIKFSLGKKNKTNTASTSSKISSKRGRGGGRMGITDVECDFQQM